MSTSNEALTRNDHSDRGDDNLRTAYEQLCLSYRAIDDFRSKLLGFLPFVTGAGVLALLGPLKAASQTLLAPIGAFGFLVTLGLFFFEIHGIRKCHSLINNGKRLECKLNVTDGGAVLRASDRYCQRTICCGIYLSDGRCYLAICRFEYDRVATAMGEYRLRSNDYIRPLLVTHS